MIIHAESLLETAHFDQSIVLQPAVQFDQEVCASPSRVLQPVLCFTQPGASAGEGEGLAQV
jgi:hypothetical protein